MGWKRAVLVVGSAMLPACGGSELAAPRLDPAALVGTWTLIGWQYTRVADPGERVDWVSSFGLTGSLTVTSAGAFTVNPRLPGGYGTDFGVLTLNGDSIYWDGEDDEQWVGAALSGAVLTLDWREVEFIDLHRSGMPDDVRLVATFRRQ